MKKYRKLYRIKNLPRRRRRLKTILKNRFLGLGILISIILSGFFYLIFFASPFQVREIEVSGNSRVSTESLQEAVWGQIERRVFFSPSKSIFLVNSNKTAENILNNFPGIAEIKINRDLPNALKVIVSERVGLIVWCQADRCFSLDKEGVIFGEVFDVTSETFKIQNLTSILELKLGKEVIEKEKLNKILEIESKLKNNFRVDISQTIVVSEERWNVKTFEGWEIYLDFEKDLDWQLAKLYSVLEKEIPSEKRGNLEYIDLRFGNFAPYKYRADYSM